MSKDIFEDRSFIKRQVMASALASFDAEPIYAFDTSFNYRWASQTKTDWLQVCFRTVSLKLTKYTYSTEPQPIQEQQGALKSWKLLGTVNGTEWEQIDQINDSQKTNGPNITSEFQKEVNNYYNCYRIVGIDTWRTEGTELWTVSHIGLYGELKKINVFNPFCSHCQKQNFHLHLLNYIFIIIK